MFQKHRVLFLVILFIQVNQLFCVRPLMNFVLDTKIDHDFVIGKIGTKAWDDPIGVTIVSHNNDIRESSKDSPTFYIADAIANRFLYSLSDTIYKDLGVRGSGSGQFIQPYGIVAARDGRVYVSEFGNHRISMFQKNKDAMSFVRHIGGYGTALGQFINPRYCALDANETSILICDWGNSRIQKINAINGAPIHAIVPPDDPMGIAVAADDTVFVVTSSGIILRYSMNGILEKAINLDSFGINNSLAFSIGCDFYKNIYIIDRGNNCVHILDAELGYLGTFGSYGQGPAQLNDPRDIHVISDRGMAIITEKTGVKLYYLGADIADLLCTPSTFYNQSINPDSQSTSITYITPIESLVTARIISSTGREIKRLFTKLLQLPGKHLFAWDGKDDFGANVLGGVYTIEVSAQPYYGYLTSMKVIKSVNVEIKAPPVVILKSISPMIIDNNNNMLQIEYSANIPSAIDVTAVKEGIVKDIDLFKLKALDNAEANEKRNCSWDAKTNGTLLVEGYYKFRVNAIDPLSGNIGTAYKEFVINFFRLQVDNIALTRQKINPKNNIYNQTVLAFFTSEEAEITTTIKKNGNCIRTIASARKAYVGSNAFIWDGTLDNGSIPPDGDYTIEAHVFQRLTDETIDIVKTVTIDTTPPTITSTKDYEFVKHISPNEASSIGNKDNTAIKYKVNEASKCVAEIYNPEYQLVRTISRQNLNIGTEYKTLWDGKDNNGVFVPDGEYSMTISAMDDVANTSAIHETIVVDNNSSVGGISYVTAPVAVTPDISEVNPQWTPAGNSVVYLEEKERYSDNYGNPYGKYALRKMDIATGAVTTIVDEIVSPLVKSHYTSGIRMPFSGSGYINVHPEGYKFPVTWFWSINNDPGQTKYFSQSGTLNFDSSGVAYSPYFSLPDLRADTKTYGYGYISLSVGSPNMASINDVNFFQPHYYWGFDNNEKSSYTYSSYLSDSQFIYYIEGEPIGESHTWNDNAYLHVRFRFRIAMQNWKTSVETAAAKPASVPLCSPDGTKVIYLNNKELWISDLNGSGKRMLVDSCVESYSPGVWNPNGTSVYVVRSVAGETPSLWKVNLAGGLDQITSGVQVYAPTLSIDGSRIAFISEDGNGGGVFTVNSDGSGYMRVSPRSQLGYWYASPCWSPDGSRIAYAMAENRGGNYNVFNTASDGSGSVIQCTTTASLDTEPQWSADGAKILFLSSRSGTVSLWSMNADGSQQTIVTRYQRGVNAPAFLRGSDTLVFSATNGSATDIFIRRPVVGLNLNAIVLAPIDMQMVTGYVPIRGYVNDGYFDKYLLSYGLGANPSDWSPLSSGIIPANDAVVGAFPTSSLADGTYSIKLSADDKAGNTRSHQIRLSVINQDTDIVRGFTTSQYYVSRNNRAIIFYDLQVGAMVALRIFDQDGNIVSTIFTEDQASGQHSIEFTGNGILDGTYTCNLDITKDARHVTQKLPLEIDNTLPTALISSPIPDNVLSSSSVQIKGTAQDINFTEYILEYANGLSPVETDYIQLAHAFEEKSASDFSTLNTDGMNGYYTLRLRVRDRANNESIQIITGNIDKTPPIAKITFPLNNSTAGNSLSIKATAKDINFVSYNLSYGAGTSPSDWMPLVTDVLNPVQDQEVFSGWDTSAFNGSYSIRLSVKDIAGNETSDVVSVFFDKTPPTTVVVPVIPVYQAENGNNFATALHKFKLSSTPGDDYSTVDHIEMSIDGTPWTTYSGLISFETEGAHTIQYKAVDNFGNWEEAKAFTVIVDNSAPGCVFNPGPAGSYYENNGKTYVPARNNIYFDPTDLGLIPSGVNGLYYSTDNGTSYKSYAGEGLLITKAGENNIKYYCDDFVGNVAATKVATVILDPGAPVVTPVLTGISYEAGDITYIRSAHEIAITVSENNNYDSGLAYFAYQLNGGNWWTYTYPIVFTSAGINTITWNAVDNVGNVNNMTKVYCVDNDAPLITLSTSVPLTTIGQVKYAPPHCVYTITASDDFSGVNKIEISLDGGAYTSYFAPISFGNDGIHSIAYKASDNLGNETDAKFISVTVDGTPPSSILVSSSPLVKIGDSYYADPTWRFSISSTDVLSGVKNIFLDLNGSGFNSYSGAEFTLVSGANTIRYKAIDNVGNEEPFKEITITTPIPDVTPPGTTATLNKNGLSLPISDVYYVNDLVTLTLSAIDPVVNGYFSGVKRSEYRLPSGDWTFYDTPVSLGGIGTDPYIVAYRSIDNIGNVETEKTITIIKDVTPPIVAVNNVASGGFYKPGIAASFSVVEANLSAINATLDGNPYSSGTPINTEGTHTIVVSAVDKAGNQDTKTISFTVDGTLPIVSISNVVSGSFYKAGTAPIFNATDLNLFAVNATLNGSVYTSGTPITADGAHTLQVTAVDKADNSATQSVSFTVDGTPPAVTITGVTNGAFYLTPMSAQVAISDLNLQSSSVTLNGEPYVSGTLISGEGQRTLIATAQDKAGNETTKTITFGIDTQTPRITITGAVDSGFYRPALSIFYTAEDANLISLSAALDKKNYISGDPITKNGTHTLTVTAKDKYGRVTTKTITFTIDGKEPNVVVAGVQDGKYYRHPVMPIIVIHDENISNKTITLNGDPYTPKTWVKVDGNYTLVADAIDKAGNRKTVTVKFVIDTKAPVIAISGVADDVSYTNAVTPVISVTDANSDWSKTILVSCGNDDHRKHDCHDKHCGDVFVSGTPITNDGTYLLIVFAKDKADNTTAKSISFSIDTQLPVITVSGVNNGGYYKPNTAASYFAYDVNLVSCSATLDGVAYSSGTPIKNDGVHTLTVKATDKAGHVAFKTVSFTTDGIQPIVSITGVDNDGCYMPGIAPQVNVIDLNLLSSTITLDNAPYTSGSAVTVDGMHTLYAYGVDRAGNFAAKTIKFTVDGTTPAITVSGADNDGIYNRTVTVDVSVYDANLKRTYITLDNVPTTSHIVVSGEGAHTVHIEADDKAGNRSMKDITFVIDKTLPVVLVEGVVNNGTYTKATIGVKLYEDNYDAARTSFKLDSQEYAQTITNGVDSGGTRFYGLSIANITNTGAHTLSYSVTDKAGNKVTGIIAFTISPFDMNAERSFYANFDSSTKATYAKGDKDDYSGVKVIVSGGYMTNCVAPGVTSGDVVVQYKAQNNMRMDKGTFAMWVKPNWTKPTNSSIVSFANSSLGKVPLAIYATKTNETILSVSGKNNGAKSITATTNWMMNRDWTYIGFTWSSEAKEHGTSEVALSFFINGTVVGTLTMHDPAFDDIYWMLLGYGMPDKSWKTFTGKLDETRVYEKALSADEIKALFESEKMRVVSSPSGDKSMVQSMSQGNGNSSSTISEERTGGSDLATQ